MRILCAAAVLFLVPGTTAAQDRLSSAPLQMGLPSASLDRRPLPVPSRRDVFLARPGTFDEPPAVDPRFFPCCGPVFGGPVFFPGVVPGVFAGFANEPGPVVPSWARRSTVNRTPAAESAGYVRLLVEPETAQVHVDGFFVGTVADLGRLLHLEPGAHRVELRAPGYEATAFDVHIFSTVTITYRANLRPASSAPATPPPAVGVPKTFYVIPNCYAGDKPPDRSTLPATCDVSRLRTIPPVVSGIRR